MHSISICTCVALVKLSVSAKNVVHGRNSLLCFQQRFVAILAYASSCSPSFDQHLTFRTAVKSRWAVYDRRRHDRPVLIVSFSHRFHGTTIKVFRKQRLDSFRGGHRYFFHCNLVAVILWLGQLPHFIFSFHLLRNFPRSLCTEAGNPAAHTAENKLSYSPISLTYRLAPIQLKLDLLKQSTTTFHSK